MRRLLGQSALCMATDFACAGLLAFAGCGDDDGTSKLKPDAMVDASKPDRSDSGDVDAAISKAVSYNNDVQPIFTLHCTICHHPGGIIDLDLTNPFDAEHGIIDRPNSWAIDHASKIEKLVKPGSPEDSFLIYKVAADPDPAKFDVTNNGDPMPFETPLLTEAEIDAIKQWITDGAKNDASFAGKVAPIFGTQVTLGRNRGKCTFCHYPDSPTGLNILDVFNPDTGLVGADSISSPKKRVAPGSPEASFLVEKVESAMPKGGARMPLQYPRLSAAELDTLKTWIELGAKND
jgi:hypothetical protein